MVLVLEREKYCYMNYTIYTSSQLFFRELAINGLGTAIVRPFIIRQFIIRQLTIRLVTLGSIDLHLTLLRLLIRNLTMSPPPLINSPQHPACLLGEEDGRLCEGTNYMYGCIWAQTRTTDRNSVSNMSTTD